MIFYLFLRKAYVKFQQIKTLIFKPKSERGCGNLPSRGPLHSSLGFAGMDLLFDRGPFVVLLFSLAYSDLDFDLPFFEIHPKRNDREALAAHLPHQTVDLVAIQEKFSGTRRVDLLIALQPGIRRNMAIKKKGFLFHDPDIAVLQIHAMFADRFDLMAQKPNPRLIFILDKIVVMSLAVLSNGFIDDFGGFGFGFLFLLYFFHGIRNSVF